MNTAQWGVATTYGTVRVAAVAIRRQLRQPAQPWMICGLTGRSYGEVNTALDRLVGEKIAHRSEDGQLNWVRQVPADDPGFESFELAVQAAEADLREKAPRLVSGVDDAVRIRALIALLASIHPGDPFQALDLSDRELLADTLDITNAIPEGDPAATPRPWRQE